MAGPHSRLRSIGKSLQDEEARFIGYPEIERKTRELGFGVSVRTIRFYVDEGILPAPKKVGKTPVYEEEWILNVLLSIHLMKSRLNRSLTEIRTILGALQESPERLADRLSVLYEEYVKGGALKPLERAGLVDAFFDLLCGRLSEPRQASQVRLADLAEVVGKGGRWEDARWIPPGKNAILASQGLLVQAEAKAAIPPTQKVERELAPPEAPPREEEPPPTRDPAPADAVTARQARAIEQAFVQRFKTKFERLGRVLCPIDGKGYKAGPREHTFHKGDRSTDVVELMKSRRIYDRSLLDVLPLDERREFRVFQRGLFTRGDLKVVVTAIVLSPIEAFVTQRWAKEPLGPLLARRAIQELEVRDGVFHYVGILSTVGWSKSAIEHIPARRNMLVCLVENRGASAWRVHHVADERWGGVEQVFDPETEEEKVDRVREHMVEHLRPKGEFLILADFCEDLDVPRTLVQTAIDELLAEDGELTVTSSGGREIIKRSRL